MKIAVITRMLRSNRLEGFGVFTHEIFSRIIRLHPDAQFYFLFDRPYDSQFIYGPNVKPVVLLPPASHPKLLEFWYQVRLRWFLKLHRMDLLISPDGGIPLHSRTPSLSVIHDLNFEHFPEDLPPGVRNYYLRYYRKAAHAATRLATVSEFSRQDIANTYGVRPDKIDVIYNGVSDEFRSLSEAESDQARKKFSGGKNYFLFIGSIHQRKNLPNMMKAFKVFRDQSGSDSKFIIAGAKRWWSDEMERAFQESSGGDVIQFPGRIHHDDLPALIGGAHALLFASRFEGFGIPIIEAMKCGVPVITSNVTSMPEVAGEAALLVDPDSVDSIARAMLSINEDHSLRKSLSARGIERARSFTWDDAAERCWNIILKAAAGAARS